MTQMDIELLTVGRISVDLYAEQLNVPLEVVQSFRKSIGGTATNVAVATARLGHHAALVTRVGDDPMGRYIRYALEDTFKVDTRYVQTDPNLRTPLAFATMEDPAEPTVDFYRAPQAPDMMILPTDVDRTVVEGVRIFWFPASRFAFEPSRSTMHEMLVWRQRSQHTVLDLDWRPAFWPDAATARAEISPAIDHASIVIGNRTECEIAIGVSDPELAADVLISRGVTSAVIKMGGDGVLVATAGGDREHIPPNPVNALSGLCAGDAFGGAFCHGLLSGWTIADCARAGNAAGAIVAARLMCADDMPYLSDIELVLTRGSVPEGI
jgi:5-dehydro-2-deoxygluconokinase